jgi:hypothetical protein
MPSDPYSRFYWRFRDEFADIYADKTTLGWWLTLLVTEEGAYPAAPELPRRITKKAINALVEAGLLELLPGDRYRVRGASKERAMRSENGRNAAALRWHSERNANPMPRRDETSKDKKRRDETRRGSTGLSPIKSILEGMR